MILKVTGGRNRMRLTSEEKKVRQEYGGCLEEVTRLRAETICEVITVTQAPHGGGLIQGTEDARKGEMDSEDT